MENNKITPALAPSFVDINYKRRDASQLYDSYYDWCIGAEFESDVGGSCIRSRAGARCGGGRGGA